MTRILVIDDEADLQTLLRWNLERAGYEVITASTGRDGLQELKRAQVDLVLLDRMLPDQDGLEICRILRSSARTVGILVIMLTAKDDENDLVAGLGVGADDYIAKPFRPRELLARIAARLTRQRPEMIQLEPQRIQIDQLVIDTIRYEITIAGEHVPATLTEFRLLHVLAANKGMVHSRRAMLARISESNILAADRTIDVHIRNLRRKIKPFDQYIEAIRGVGYRFRESALQPAVAS